MGGSHQWLVLGAGSSSPLLLIVPAPELEHLGQACSRKMSLLLAGDRVVGEFDLVAAPHCPVLLPKDLSVLPAARMGRDCPRGASAGGGAHPAGPRMAKGPQQSHR